jgi:FkbM family methyltransferase
MMENLIYDVGLHKGEDSEFYLRKGFSVIGIEADPELIASARVRLGDAIALGTLTLVEGAVAPASMGDGVAFYRNRGNSVWGTIRPEWMSRNEMLGCPSDRREVNRIDIAQVFRSSGIPFYLKIDIEGADHLVLDALKEFEDRPQYVSLESEKINFDALKYEMELLKSLGYSSFKIVQQETIGGSEIQTRTVDGQSLTYVFEPGSSGPFGDDIPGPWLNYDDALEEYVRIFRRYRLFGDYSPLRAMPMKLQSLVKKFYRVATGTTGPLPGWFDTHAKL